MNPRAINQTANPATERRWREKINTTYAKKREEKRREQQRASTTMIASKIA